MGAPLAVSPESLLLLKLAKAVKEIKARQPEKGDAGREPTADEIFTAVSLWMEFHREEVRGEPGKTPKAIPGPSGVGIDDLDVEDGELVVALTDGRKKRFKLPEIKDRRYNTTLLGAAGTGLSKSEADTLYAPISASPYVVGEIKHSRFTLGTGWLLQDGSTYNVDDYPALGALYGGTAGGTFTVDDWRGVPIFGADGINATGTLTGSDTQDLTHTHTITASSATAGDHTHTATGSTAGAGGHNHGGVTGVPSASVSRGPPQLLGNIDVATDTHTHTIGSVADHTHATTVTVTGVVGHTHGITATAADSLGSIDKRPRRAYANVYIRALP
jgi:microcystin-dependent protein